MSEQSLLSIDDSCGVRIVRIEVQRLLEAATTSRLTDELASATAKSERIVVDLRKMKFVSSQGISMLFMLSRKANKDGHKIAFVASEGGVSEVFHAMRLDKVIDVYPSQEEAVRSFGIPTVEIACPLFACTGWTHQAVARDDSSREEFTCPDCGTMFVVEASSGQVRRVVSRLSVPTYDRECIRVIRAARSQDLGKQEGNRVMRRTVWRRWWRKDRQSDAADPISTSDRGHRHTIHIEQQDLVQLAGRLDLLSVELLLRACRSIPEPRRILVDLVSAEDITDRGLQLLSELCRSAERSVDRFVVLIRSVHHGRVGAFIEESTLFTEMRDAVTSLNDGCPVTPLFVETRQRLGIES